MKKLPIVSAKRRLMRPLTCHTGRALVAGETEDRRERSAATGASVLISGDAYGVQPQAELTADRLAARGFRAVIAPGFTPTAYLECVAEGLAPVILEQAIVADLLACLAVDRELEITVDLENGVVEFGGRDPIAFVLDPRARRKLLLGLDELDEMLEHRDTALAFRSENRRRLPWLADPFRSNAGLNREG